MSKSKVTLDTEPRIFPDLSSRGPDENYVFKFSVATENGKPVEGEITIRCSSDIWTGGPKTEKEFDPSVLKAVARELAGDMIVESIKSGKTSESRLLSKHLYNQIRLSQALQSEPKYGKTFDV
ncbi:MAG: hypothetical protein ABSC38_00560 [Verrucomicrobiia bacterium]